MKTTNDDCVGIRGNNKRFGRGETHESSLALDKTRAILKILFATMSHALAPHTVSDIFHGKFCKITKKINKTST